LQLRELIFAPLDRPATKVFTVEFKEIKGVQLG
jgi:hypothetical protein